VGYNQPFHIESPKATGLIYPVRNNAPLEFLTGFTEKDPLQKFFTPHPVKPRVLPLTFLKVWGLTRSAGFAFHCLRNKMKSNSNSFN
jgi:hypothetical protein